MFSCEFCEILRTSILQNTSGRLLPKESDHPRKDLINIQSIDDNECFKWYLVRYIHPANHNPKRKKKKRILSPLAFLVVKTKRNIQSTYQKNVDYY